MAVGSAYAVEGNDSKADHPAYGAQPTSQSLRQPGAWPLEVQNTRTDPPLPTNDDPSKDAPSGWWWDTFPQWVMAGTSVLAVILIYVTFRETRKTVKYASEMNEISRKANMLQNRAWLFIEHFDMKFYSAHVTVGSEETSHWIWCTVYYTIRNSGFSPALNVIDSCLAFDDVVPAHDEKIVEFEENLRKARSRGGGRVVPPNTSIEEETVALVKVDKKSGDRIAIDIILGISYNTIFYTGDPITLQSFCVFERQDEINSTPMNISIAAIQSGNVDTMIKRIGASKMS